METSMLRILALSIFFAGFPLAAQQHTQTTVILVRHADKAALPAEDPALTAEGQARAQALVAIARDAGVTAIITTQFARTRETARPAAEALRITPEIVSAGGAQHAQEVAKAILSGHAGAVVLVVGHSNTIPAIVAALGAPRPPPICDSEYDGFYVVTVPATGPARVIHALYRQPSPALAGCGGMKH